MWGITKCEYRPQLANLPVEFHPTYENLSPEHQLNIDKGIYFVRIISLWKKKRFSNLTIQWHHRRCTSFVNTPGGRKGKHALSKWTKHKTHPTDIMSISFLFCSYALCMSPTPYFSKILRPFSNSFVLPSMKSIETQEWRQEKWSRLIPFPKLTWEDFTSLS